MHNYCQLSIFKETVMYRSLKNKYLKYVFQQKQPLVYMYVRAGIEGSIKN
jgi:hypothetical protein